MGTWLPDAGGVLDTDWLFPPSDVSSPVRVESAAGRAGITWENPGGALQPEKRSDPPFLCDCTMWPRLLSWHRQKALLSPYFSAETA